MIGILNQFIKKQMKLKNIYKKYQHQRTPKQTQKQTQIAILYIIKTV